MTLIIKTSVWSNQKLRKIVQYNLYREVGNVGLPQPVFYRPSTKIDAVQKLFS